MNYTDLENSYQKISQLVAERRVKESFDLMAGLAANCRNVDYSNRLEKLRETYRNILKYSFELGDDPEKGKVYNRLIRDLLELNDEIKEEIILRYGLLTYYKTNQKEMINKMGLTEGESLLNQIEFRNMGNPDPEGGENIDEAGFNSRMKPLYLLFNTIWLTDKFTERDVELLKRTSHDEALPWFFKSPLVSALTLSLLRHFDAGKFYLLIEFYENRQHQLWQRAFIGLLLGLYIYRKRISLYPEIENRLKLIKDNKDMGRTMETVVIQLLRAKDTEKVSAKIKEEIMPEIWKIRSSLEDKLNIEELLAGHLPDDKNPEWETFFEDSPGLFNKLEEFTNLHMEGTDVFISAFSMLKHFEFFKPVHNWFLPFYKENEMLPSFFSGIDEGFDMNDFLEGMEKTRLLCNSDKYSFCLNIKYMPSKQKSMMTQMFSMEISAMNEMERDDEIVHTDTRNRSIIVQYIQDLYRFFHLHPMHGEMQNIFKYKLEFHKSGFFRSMVDDDTIIRNIGEFYFQKEHYEEALDVFIMLGNEASAYELYEKTGYCYQQLGKFEKAIEFYKKAEMVSDNRTWLLNKIASCYRKTENYSEAIAYYRKSEKLDPDNLFIQTSIGQVLMDQGEYEAALKYFFKVEYLAPDNFKVYRPIAWCSFVLGKIEAARKYFEKLVAKDGNEYDLMNLGHVYWTRGEKQKAIGLYRESLKKSNMNLEWFTKYMKEDEKYLLQYKIPAFDIPLMLDYLRME